MNISTQSSTEELAFQRTGWALQRTRMATERTLIAWLSTGLAILGFGAVIPRLLDGIQPSWLVNGIAVLFVFVGVGIVSLGIYTYHEMTAELPEEERGISWWVIAVLTGLVQVAAIAVLLLFIVG